MFLWLSLGMGKQGIGLVPFHGWRSIFTVFQPHYQAPSWKNGEEPGLQPPLASPLLLLPCRQSYHPILLPIETASQGRHWTWFQLGLAVNILMHHFSRGISISRIQDLSQSNKAMRRGFQGQPALGAEERTWKSSQHLWNYSHIVNICGVGLGFVSFATC